MLPMSQPNSSGGRALTDYLQIKAIQQKIPLCGTFELSPVCNFSCKMCYVRKTRKEVDESPRKILTLEDWRRIAREALDAGVLELLLTGGEPLLWPDFWTLYEELIDMGILISINTNGSLIDDAAIARFRKKPPQRINITLYGASDETYQRLCGIHGVFTKVDNAICGLMDAGITVKLNCSLTPENAKDLDWMMAYAKKRNTAITVGTYMFPPIRRDPTSFGVNQRFTPEESAKYQLRYLQLSRDEERYQDCLDNILNGYAAPPGLDADCIDPIDGKIRCRAGKSSFWITWDGWLTPCGMLPEPVADLKELSFAQGWRAITEASAALRLSSVCDTCKNRDICHPCAAISYAETGSFSGIPTYMCRATQEMYKIACDTMHIEDKAQSPIPGK